MLSELPKTPLPNGLPPLLPSDASRTRLSPPNVSALLDISLPGPPEDVLSQGEPATHISDSIIEIAISSGQYGEAFPTPGLPMSWLLGSSLCCHEGAQVSLIHGFGRGEAAFLGQLGEQALPGLLPPLSWFPVSS